MLWQHGSLTDWKHGMLSPWCLTEIRHTGYTWIYITTYYLFFILHSGRLFFGELAISILHQGWGGTNVGWMEDFNHSKGHSVTIPGNISLTKWQKQFKRTQHRSQCFHRMPFSLTRHWPVLWKHVGSLLHFVKLCSVPMGISFYDYYHGLVCQLLDWLICKLYRQLCSMKEIYLPDSGSLEFQNQCPNLKRIKCR